MIKNTKKIIVMASGTGGHVFPGLTVSRYLIKQGWQVRWLGTPNRIENTLVPKHGIHIYLIDINGLRNRDFKNKLYIPVNLYRSFRQAQKIMKAWQPDVVLGMGGYVSGPGSLAAWNCGIPVVLHEQNRVAGLTNRYLSKIASTVLQAFPGALSCAEVVGNPVRDEILALPEPSVRFLNRSGPIRVLIVGGSQGSYLLNTTMPEVAIKSAGNLIMWHQVGRKGREIEEVNSIYSASKEKQHKVVEFIDNIATAYAWADVIVCRSGALTVSEIIAVGLPAIFVPFMHKDYHQYWNAKLLEKAGAAKIIEQSSFSVKRVSELLASWDRSTLLNMAISARLTAVTPDATKRIARAVLVAGRF